LQEQDLAAIVRQSVEKYAGQKRGRFVTIRKNVSIAVAQQIRQATRVSSFWVLDGSLRNYSSGADAAQVIGFLGPDDTGAAGLERSCATFIKEPMASL